MKKLIILCSLFSAISYIAYASDENLQAHNNNQLPCYDFLIEQKPPYHIEQWSGYSSTAIYRNGNWTLDYYKQIHKDSHGQSYQVAINPSEESEKWWAQYIQFLTDWQRNQDAQDYERAGKLYCILEEKLPHFFTKNNTRSILLKRLVECTGWDAANAINSYNKIKNNHCDIVERIQNLFNGINLHTAEAAVIAAIHKIPESMHHLYYNSTETNNADKIYHPIQEYMNECNKRDKEYVKINKQDIPHRLVHKPMTDNDDEN